jgi:RimJ/RimL family protein N-acetyltransferase
MVALGLRTAGAEFDIGDGRTPEAVTWSAMSRGPEIGTLRLRLRRWREGDLDPFAALNADPVVMEHFHHGVRTRAETADFMARIEQEFESRGFGLWAVEVPGVAPFIGFVGLHAATFEAPFTPAVEVGWRLAHAYWGQGFATEAARAALAFGFEGGGLDEIVSFTSVGNVRSQRVMQRIGMTRDLQGDFDHPAVPPGHPIRPHVLYRIRREAGSRQP